MHYNTEYLMALENCIMDDLLPMYIIGCRSVGKDPATGPILKKLLESRTLKTPIPWLLQTKPDIKKGF